MDKITFSVKGDRAQAEAAMAAHGVAAAAYAGGSRDFNTTSWEAPPSQRPAIASWLREPACANKLGFPAGTLLHHT